MIAAPSQPAGTPRARDTTMPAAPAAAACAAKSKPSTRSPGNAKNSWPGATARLSWFAPAKWVPRVPGCTIVPPIARAAQSSGAPRRLSLSPSRCWPS